MSTFASPIRYVGQHSSRTWLYAQSYSSSSESMLFGSSVNSAMATFYVYGPPVQDRSPEQTSRELLQRRMPPRSRIEAIVDRTPAHDPWLDDEYDWRP